MGVLERKQREKVHREMAILDAAKKVFLAKGLIVATIDDIATEAELSKGTLYRYYRSKEEILLAINEQALRELHQEFTRATAGDGNGLDKILRMNRAYYQFVVANPVYFGFITFFESPFTSTTAAVVYETTTAINELVMGLVEMGKQDGSIRTDLKTNLIASIIWAGSYGTMQFIVNKGHLLAQDYQVDLDELFETFLTTVDHGLRANK
ncbi:TetR/AcrR family transcriptional regulator [Hymenobacter terrestris]|uniref:TetR/AcrR family transcriptional regulator n=1 Tax=Hymenobacter terrestris TaxID=2748310 RepID=A0ABX2Q5T7_9BACT|nr:TetR/AcrR family transcriptional regulator [Hymenobacter terrestris]NVO86329.1 TetR/AcrR family transcriptional regulator [Hymenobacter terrestris]